MDLCKRRWGQHAFAVAALAVMSGLTACAQTEIIQTAKKSGSFRPVQLPFAELLEPCELQIKWQLSQRCGRVMNAFR